MWELQATVKFYELTSELLNAKVRGAIAKPCLGKVLFFFFFLIPGEIFDIQHKRTEGH